MNNGKCIFNALAECLAIVLSLVNIDDINRHLLYPDKIFWFQIANVKDVFLE